MEALIESYRLPFAPFRELIKSTNSLVAGSAALALYLQQNGIEPGFVPGDIDIWAEDTLELIAARGAYCQHGNLYLFSNFLIQNGFNVTIQYEPKETDYENFHNIAHILSFINREGKSIQLILLREKNIFNYIYNNFDLSPCITWWNSGVNTFDTMWPEETLRKEMYYYPTREINAREIERIEKYKERGFRLIDRPCPAIGIQDMRTDLSCLSGQTAFDLFAYEDVDCINFLEYSSWHMLMRVGERFHAFHRKDLVDYMKQHVYEFQGERLYETPYKQTLLHPAIIWFAWSDYSIVELLPSYTIQDEDVLKSVYKCHFYTVQQWAERQPGHIEGERPPSEITYIPRPIPLYQEDVYSLDG